MDWAETFARRDEKHFKFVVRIKFEVSDGIFLVEATLDQSAVRVSKTRILNL